jgi:pimeloyl-ACP methyl ester carboxylesterase
MADANGVRLQYLRTGTGPAVVLLHGWPQHSHHWRRIMPALGEHFTVIAPDQRGAGGSAIPTGPYDKNTLADDISALLRVLDVGPAAVIGYDHGGGTAYAMAARTPDQVWALGVLEYAPAGYGYEAGLTASPWNENWQLAFFTNPDVASRFLQGQERELLSWYFWHWSYNANAISMADFELYVRELQKPGALRAGFSYFASVYQDIEANKVLGARKLTQPVLALGGARGAGEYPLMAMRALAENVEGGVVERAGHWLTDEEPEQLTSRLLTFLQEHQP